MERIDMKLLLFITFSSVIGDSFSFDMTASKSPDTAVMGISSPKFSLICTYILDSGETFLSLQLLRKRSNESEFIEIVSYPGPALTQNVTYLNGGQQLENRTTATRPTANNPSAVLTFNEIQCSDKAVYKWRATYFTTTVQYVERMITFNIQANSKFADDGLLSFTPSINIVEGHRVQFTCEGDVGAEPMGSIAWYYYLENSLNGILLKDSVSENPVFNSTSCSYHRRSTMTLTMTREYDGIVVRCTAQQTRYDQLGDGHLQTSRIPVFYSPRIIQIEKIPNLSDYKEGMKALTLNCQGEANPDGSYYWELADNTTVQGHLLTLNDLNVDHTGVYTCYATNEFLGSNHTVSQSLRLNITATTSNQCSSTLNWSSSSNVPGTCNFENGTCDYYIRSPWERNSSYVLDKYYQPIKARDGGHYIVMDRHSPFIDSFGRFVSSDIPPGDYCLTFWYYITYSAVRLIGNTTTGNVFCNLTEESLDTVSWKNFTVELHENTTFQISFTSIHVQHDWYVYKHTSLVDDIYLNRMVQTTSVPKPTSTLFPMIVNSTFTTMRTNSTAGQNNVTSLPGTLSLEDIIHHGCTNSGWNITIDMNLMKQLYPNITNNNVYFGDNTCRGLQSGSYLLFQQGFRDCLTSERISNDTFIYENDLFSVVHDPINPTVIRRHDWTYTVECRIDRNVVTSSHVLHNASSHHVTQTTHYGINLAFYSDSNFMSQLTGNPVHSQVGSYLYTKVYSTISDWSIKMRLHTCYTDTGSDTNKNTTYYLIKDGCEVDANTHIISQSTHETRFVFQDFEYSSDKEGLYVHCNATFCKSNDFTVGCRQSCNPDQLLIG
ncbi:hypothetical protein ACF0H5_002469 [Mactra antiquata]